MPKPSACHMLMAGVSLWRGSAWCLRHHASMMHRSCSACLSAAALHLNNACDPSGTPVFWSAAPPQFFCAQLKGVSCMRRGADHRVCAFWRGSMEALCGLLQQRLSSRPVQGLVGCPQQQHGQQRQVPGHRPARESRLLGPPMSGHRLPAQACGTSMWHTSTNLPQQPQIIWLTVRSAAFMKGSEGLG